MSGIATVTLQLSITEDCKLLSLTIANVLALHVFNFPWIKWKITVLEYMKNNFEKPTLFW